MPLSARSKDFRIKTDGEHTWTTSGNQSYYVANYGFTLKNPFNSSTEFRDSYSAGDSEYKIHDTGVLAITEGDYILEIEYIWRFQNQGGYSAITDYYGTNANAPSLALGKDTNSTFTSNTAYSFLCNGTYTQIGLDISHAQTKVSTYTLNIEKKFKFRVEGNPIVPKWTNFNWGSYTVYTRGTSYDLKFQKFPLYTLS